MGTASQERIFVLQVSWAERQHDLHSIRHAVFVEEQSVPAGEEWDGQDEHCIHFLAVNEAGVPLGCTRLQANGKIERMAVLESARGLGIGAKLLHAAVEAAGDSGLTQLYLHAQRQAEPFYQRMGFLAEGGTFVEANIDHVRMTMGATHSVHPNRQLQHSLERQVQQANRTACQTLLVAQPSKLCTRGRLAGKPIHAAC